MTVTLGITADSFRIDYPEFSDLTVYPDSVVNYYLALAGMLLNPCRWGQPGPLPPTNPPTAIIDMAAELFIAHNLALEYQAQKAAAAGGAPGMVVGPVSNKAVGPISMGYDTSAAIDKDAGHWNLTIYGLRLWRLIEMFGAGPVYIGPSVPPYAGGFLYMGDGWFGPPPWPGWFTS